MTADSERIKRKRNQTRWRERARRPIELGSLSPKSRQLISEYRGRASQMTERQRAIMERQIWDALHQDDRSRLLREVFLKQVLGVSSMHASNRSAMLGYGQVAEPLWQRTECADSPMLITTAARVFREAKKLAVANEIPVADALALRLADYESGELRRRPYGSVRVRSGTKMPSLDEARRAAKTKNKNKTRKRQRDPSSNDVARASHGTREFWVKHREMMSVYLAERLGDDDGTSDLVVEQLYREFESELRAAVDGFTNRICQRKNKLRESKEVSERTLRKRVKAALGLFGMDLPRSGQRFDLALLKKRYRKAAATYHPDKHPGNEQAAMEQQFHHITGAYEQVLLWYEQVYENRNNEERHG